ncbi:RICIN domain-containing protein [[Clostridium] polysaccharolyticum]|uniref:Glucuronoarabinoxylan endo-1,4-beta-xylanase n=1 Tax=[Clostridium] polysaccharolyticum TaxID=29364 RepID=A0A1I0CJV2_9FIRM|nr:RICIN domain-containing protein [[Clostridium] polysaccharolyticum]SET19730.1 glucuronoarabinoxylan endo-1,4-beta-xylanase [[Clostridium] polysaccharolyticum]
MFNKTVKKICVLATSITLAVASIVPFSIKNSTIVQAASDVTVNLASEKQTMQGIGGINHPVWTSDLSSAQRETAFGNGANQLGFSILRIHVDENKNNWSKELATAKAAVAKGALVFASPWNPPASMCEKFTRNGKPNQQRLKYSSYGAYADYLNEFVTYMKNNGVNLYAISVQNEPDYADTWTWWTPQEMLNFMKNYAGKINCKVMAPESFQYLKNMSDPILNDAAALANMDILGTHFYGTQPSQMSYPLFKQKGQGKELWMTEVYVPDSSSSANAWPNALKVAVNMNDAFARGDMQAYVWWYIRRSYGPMLEDGSISKRGYCMAQYSKFIRRGYKRVDATLNPESNVYVSAYKGDGKAVIVATNDTDQQYTKLFNVTNGSIKKVDRYRTSGNESLAKTENLALTGNGFYASLPARSVSTFVCDLGTGSVTTSAAPSAKPSVAPSAVPAGKLQDGWYYIKNVNAQKYLQVAGNNASATANVEISTGTGSASQKWYLKNTNDGYFTLQSGLGDFMIDVANGADEDGANLQIYNAYSGTAQQFILQSTSAANVYTIGTKASNGTKVVDVYNHGKTDGTNVCQWSLLGNPNQQFIFEPVASAPSAQPSKAPSAAPSVAPSSASSASGLPSGISCEYSVVSNWGNGFQGQIVLTNKSSQSYNGWTLTFNTSNKVGSLWGADFGGQTGSKVVVKSPSWDAALASGKSVTINFVADGNASSAPSGYTFG